MPLSFYEPCGSLISPGDILDKLPPVKLPPALRVARKWSYNLPPKYRVTGELHEVLEIGKNLDLQRSRLDSAGEQILVSAKAARAIFLTWGSEVEDDERSGKVDRKDWLIAPVIPITAELRQQKVPTTNETVIDAIMGNKSPHFFYLPSIPEENSIDHYIDLRKICPVAAGHVRKLDRKWRLSGPALNDFYHQLIWFFTRQKIFFAPLECGACGAEVDLNVIFEGQPVDPEEPKT
jgi:hypothetical protein